MNLRIALFFIECDVVIFDACDKPFSIVTEIYGIDVISRFSECMEISIPVAIGSVIDEYVMLLRTKTK